MITFKNEQGIGLVEVMVALFLLSIAVLGFSALQMTAVRTTDESLMRTRALTIMRGGAETMRGHAQAINAFQAALNTPNVGQASSNDCIGALSCTPDQIAAKDAAILNQFAANHGIRLGLHDCPGTSGEQLRKCMIAAWDDTQPSFGADAPACANTSGVQHPNANCFVMEAY
ncbi:type IV pilus modification PilV family protein [Moraxella equi]|uniref:Tfp pilus assembly protein PilV n=1 Tax=Moraxella equi TaxID=60442 RepID=A0A378QQS5_9GAMM|nr:prepilin-type N-terminal cleavage/methylation domain-containing protein [Moraxella equi]MDO5050312.1 prepilin-type N-terminal cleavage/methylation domain-containing protein [Moraxella equi]OPH39641.1 hypothetical protein B5J93_03105 [Moraxella equi]STZ03227.1 Tfp pilus assembly protein PilV [Moraxella equi]